MDELLKQLQAGQESLAPGFTLAEFLVSMVLATLLSMAISLVYRRTHGGISYSRSFVLTIIIMSVTVSFIMLGMAVIFTVFSCGLLLLLDGISFGAQGRLERLLQFAFAQNEDYGDRIEADLKKLTGGHFALLSSEILGQQKVLVYSAELPRKRTTHDVLNQFASYQDLDMKILTGYDRFTI